MLRPMRDLLDLAISAPDGAIGDLKDLYFDDGAWIIRCLVVETGSWLSSHQVLIPPMGAGSPDWTNRLWPVSLSREQAMDSPAFDADGPPLGAHEAEVASLTAAGPASCHPGLWPDLHSCKALVDATVQAPDGEVGQVQDMIVDDDGWAIRYLVVSASDWWLGHDVLVAPPWIQRVSWPDRSVSVDLTREALKQAPWYDPAVPLSREMEIAVYRHHGRTGYWPGAVPATPRVQA